MVSVVIPLFNDEDNIGKCLDALISEIDPADEVIVVNNGSKDNSVNIVKLYNRVTLLDLPVGNVGAVRNYGAQFTKGKFIAFVDSDCVVSKEWRNNAIKRMCEDKKIGALGSRYKLPENSHWIEKAWFSDTQTRSKVTYINAGNLFVRKSVFHEIGGFNERLISGEDAEMCLRLSLAGYKIIEDRGVSAIHLGNPKSIKHFFKQQKWHAEGMLGTFKLNFFDKPLLMSMAFLASFLTVLVLLIHFMISKNSPNNFCIMLIILLSWVPVGAVLYRCLVSRNCKYFLTLTLLYHIYFAARASAIVEWFLLYLVQKSADAQWPKKTK